MNTPGCLVTGYQHLIPTLTLPDPEDRHVLAAAITAGCDAIVTFNLRHFPTAASAPHQIAAAHPDTFFSRHFADGPAGMLTAVGPFAPAWW